MILVNCKSFLQGATSIRNLFIQMFNYELINLANNNSLGLNQVLQIYTMEDIKRAINSIGYNNGYLEVPEQSKASKILRYLEYGGENVRPTHIIDKTKDRLYKTLSMKGDKA